MSYSPCNSSGRPWQCCGSFVSSSSTGPVLLCLLAASRITTSVRASQAAAVHSQFANGPGVVASANSSSQYWKVTARCHQLLSPACHGAICRQHYAKSLLLLLLLLLWLCRADDQPVDPGSDSSEDERPNRNTSEGY
jgi:hypothetical protein